MNLNFIQDNDKVHVQSQNQITYKQQIVLKMKLLRQDYNDYSQINPQLSQINAYFTNLVKQLYQHVSNYKAKNTQGNNILQISNTKKNQNLEQYKKKKKISIPYATLKKIQNLKLKFIQCRKIIQNQNSIYKSKNINRQNSKASQVKFYKSILKSYQNQRQFFKRQTLQLQDRIQQVQKQVRKVAANQNHKYTDFNLKYMQFQQHYRLQKKFTAIQKVIDQLKLITKTKQTIKQQLTKLWQQRQQNIQVDLNQANKYIPYGKCLTKSYLEILKKHNIYKMNRQKLLYQQKQELKKKKQRLKCINQKLKKSILQSQNEKYFVQLQKKINLLKVKSLKYYKNSELKNNNVVVNSDKVIVNRITKTDYMIYLKQLDNRLKQCQKIKQRNHKYQCQFAKRRCKSANLL